MAVATEPAAASSRKVPEVLPEPLPRPRDPSAKPPTGTPEAGGRVTHLLALDAQRAIVRFIVPGPKHAEKWWLALMHADGTIGWVRELSGDPASGQGQGGIERVGDVVTVATQHIAGEKISATLHAFALADGSRRYRVPLGNGYVHDIVADGEQRFETRVDYRLTGGGGVDAELVASGPRGVQWRRVIGAPVPVGHDPTPVADAVAVRTEERGGYRWQVFERTTGKPRGELVADPQSCSNGHRWLVRRGDELLEVDPVKVTTKKVLGATTLAEGGGTWAIVDCVFADDAPVVLLGRGPRHALATLDPNTNAVLGHVEIGTGAVGQDGFDPLPEHAHGVLALMSLAADGERELVVADPRSRRIVGRWRDVSSYVPHPFDGGYVVTSKRTVSVVDAKTGELEGRAMLEVEPPMPAQLAGASLWITPDAMRLGRAAPWVLDLRSRVADGLRDAVLADVRPVQAPGKGKAPCPDPRTVVRGDGLGQDGKLGPVARTRLPSWDLDILQETARTLACAPATAPARLLAWYVIEDDRPLRNDNALLMVEDTAASPARYTLVSVYRHATNREWNTAGSFHDPTEPLRTFDHRPTRDEIDAFLAQADWTFADAWGRVIAGNVLDDEWRAATGAAPWHAFAKGIEQPG